jgi:hypothetical protein
LNRARATRCALTQTYLEQPLPVGPREACHAYSSEIVAVRHETFRAKKHLTALLRKSHYLDAIELV